MNKVVTIILSSVLLIVLSLSLYNFFNQPKEAFVHVQEVYNEFEYKKELEQKFEATKNARKRVLDSLEIQINALGTNIQNSEVNKEVNIQNYQYLAAQYQEKQKTFAEDNEALLNQYTDQIWNQLNKYIEEFGNAHGYDFIHGADGSGSVMHANKKFNVTTELKAFVNERYQGGRLK